jgi:2-polyprenyl-6-methoxyphenol hydroxylase-like FAD-dependent oxidoreductase
MKALIIGGGIGGLATAIALARAGLEVELFERAGELSEVGAGLTLWSNALRALEAIGAGDVVAPIGLKERSGAIRAADGSVLTHITEAVGAGAPLAMVVHRAELHRGLLELIDPAQLHLGAALADFSQDAAGVTARFADGSTARGDLIIGADGVRSRVRAQLHGDTPPRYAGYTAWRAVVPFDQELLLPGESWGIGARFGQVPLADGRVYWFATASVPAGQRSRDGERAELLRRFASWHAPIPALIATAPESAILRHDIYDRPALARWGAGLVTLLGDAAHPMTPNLGQGACQALEDAAVLARCLSQGLPPDAALRRYEDLRAARTAGIVRQSRRIGAVGQWAHPLAVRLRDWLMRQVPPGVQQRQIDQLVNAQF